MTADATNDPRFIAAIDLLRRTGARRIQIRYSDDEQPVVWFLVASYGGGRWDTAAGPNPLIAALRLCESLIDGGQCKHCNRPSGFDEDFDTMPLNDVVCWYQFDPELATFRRGCEAT